MKNWVAEGIASDVNDFTVYIVQKSTKHSLHFLVEKTSFFRAINVLIFQMKFLSFVHGAQAVAVNTSFDRFLNSISSV